MKHPTKVHVEIVRKQIRVKRFTVPGKLLVEEPDKLPDAPFIVIEELTGASLHAPGRGHGHHGMDMVGDEPGSDHSISRIFHIMFDGEDEAVDALFAEIIRDFRGFYDRLRVATGSKRHPHAAAVQAAGGGKPQPVLGLPVLPGGAGTDPTVNQVQASLNFCRQNCATNCGTACAQTLYCKPCLGMILTQYPKGSTQAGTIQSIGIGCVCHFACAAA